MHSPAVNPLCQTLYEPKVAGANTVIYDSSRSSSIDSCIARASSSSSVGSSAAACSAETPSASACKQQQLP